MILVAAAMASSNCFRVGVQNMAATSPWTPMRTPTSPDLVDSERIRAVDALERARRLVRSAPKPLGQRGTAAAREDDEDAVLTLLETTQLAIEFLRCAAPPPDARSPTPDKGAAEAPARGDAPLALFAARPAANRLSVHLPPHMDEVGHLGEGTQVHRST